MTPPFVPTYVDEASLPRLSTNVDDCGDAPFARLFVPARLGSGRLLKRTAAISIPQRRARVSTTPDNRRHLDPAAATTYSCDGDTASAQYADSSVYNELRRFLILPSGRRDRSW